jgi:uncharacterized cupredoxin-like copper-binding protein
MDRVSPHRGRRLACWAVLGLSLALLCPACSGTSSTRPGSVIGVAVKDFHIGPGKTHVSAGRVAFDIHNGGPSTHEFVVVRTDLGDADLPLGPDGLSVDEDSPEIHVVTEDSELDIGESRVLVVSLPPGHYVFYCNLEGHYLGGMHASLVVS